jgi:hypothetical protein
VYRVVVRKPERTRPLTRLRCSWEDGIRMDVRKIGWQGVWSGFAWLRIVTDGRLS